MNHQRNLEGCKSYLNSRPQISCLDSNHLGNVEARVEDWLYICCTFLTERRVLIFPRTGSLAFLQDRVRHRFGYDGGSFYHRNDNRVMIEVHKEYDWQVAKWEATLATQTTLIRLELYFG
ncbi:hypothetical protein G9A89_023118 [Geosiphon pyriformis]|nr:hypothetical protein G9A89_023118 [Geosiphon pyriformis]